MSQLELRGHDDALLATEPLLVVDVIDLLKGGPSGEDDLLCVWHGNVWKTPEGESRIHLHLEGQDPAATLTVQARDLGSPDLEVVELWSGPGPLFFRPYPGDDLELVATPAVDETGVRLARLERDAGIWRAPESSPLHSRRFDKLIFSAQAPAGPLKPERRGRLSPLAGR